MHYLAYGSNLHPARLLQRVPSATLLGTTVIHDRVLQFNKRSVDGSAKCNMTLAAGAIHAAVYHVPAHEKPALDRAEGLGIGYRIETFSVAGHGECYAYVAMDTHVDKSLKPYSWYKELVLVGCESLGFPRDYIDRIAALDALEDLDLTRHEQQMQIVHSAKAGYGLNGPVGL